MEEECQVEIQLIQEELKRLGEQKKVLEDMMEYIHVSILYFDADCVVLFKVLSSFNVPYVYHVLCLFSFEVIEGWQRMLPPNATALSMRIAKRIARSGVCSRREAERWIEMGRVTLNGKVITSPAINVTQQDIIQVDNKPLSPIQRTRVIIANKLDGELVTTSDSQRICVLFIFDLRSSHHL